MNFQDQTIINEINHCKTISSMNVGYLLIKLPGAIIVAINTIEQGHFIKKIRLLKMLEVFFLVFLANIARATQIEQELFEQNTRVSL